jgi:hypothetical protein
MKFFLALVFSLSVVAFAAEAPPDNAGKVRYKKAKDVNFEELLIQGQMRRAEISVVTGDAGDGTDGLLRLRENFLDRVASDAGEEIR